MARVIVLALVFCAGLQTAYGQFVESLWTVEEGLPSADIFDIAQTPDGFIWLATDSGLARFDGVRFTTYNRANTPALTRNVIRRLFVTSDGILLIGTSGGGVTAYDYRERRFFRPFDDLVDPTMFVLSFGETENAVWVGSDGAGVYQITEDEVLLHNEDGPFPRNHIFALQQVGKDRIASAPMNYGMWYISEQGHIEPAGLPLPQANSLIYDFDIKGDVLWVATSGHGVFRYKNDELDVFTLADLAESARIATAVYADSNGIIWMGTAEGVYYSSDDMETIRPYPGLENSFSLRITEDQEGNIWIADWGRGLLRLKPATFTTISEKDGLNPGSASSVAFAAGDIWIAATGGLYRKTESGEIRLYTSEDGLGSNAPHLLLEDSRGRLIVSHFNPGDPVDFYNEETDRFQPLPFFEREPRPNAYITVLYEDHERLWIGSGMGVVTWDEDSFTLINSEYGLVNNTVRALHRDGPYLWIGTNGGLHRMHTETLDVEHISSDEAGKLGSVITTLHTDEEGNLWVGTFDSGLSVYKGGNFYPFNTGTGMPTDVVWQTVEDELGYFWMGSTSGITRVNRRQLLAYARGETDQIETRFFTIRDGLTGSSIYGNHQPTAAVGRDGTIFFPGANGVSIVDPEHILINEKEPLAVIEQILVDLEAVSKDEPLRLTHEARALEIQYTSPTFTAPQEVRFKYRLYPFEQEWQDVGIRRAAYYTTIPHGEYTFEVKAINEYGVESNRAASIPVTVLPAFWETWWFISLMILMVFGIAYGGYRYKVYNFERMNNLRLRISKDLHDEIGSNLASIAIRSSVVKKREKLSPVAMTDLDEIRSLSRLTAESMRDIVWLINPDNDKMENLITKLREVTSNMLVEIPWSFDTNLTGKQDALELQKRRVLVLIAKEALHNIVKHSGAEKVVITLEKQHDILVFTISDDGNGFDPEGPKGTGLGLRSMQERAADVGGVCTVSSQPGEGTKLELRMPY